jgi:hypothetical protein
MLTGVMQNIEQAVDPKVLVRGEVEQDLASPAKADAGKGAAVLEAFNG